MKGVKEKHLASKMQTSPEKFPVNRGFCNLYSNGEIHTTVAFPRAAEYVFRIRAFGDQAGKEPAGRDSGGKRRRKRKTAATVSVKKIQSPKTTESTRSA